MTLDIAEFRRHFPSLESGIAYFDGPGGTQTPRSVGAAVADTLCGPLSNRGGAMVASERRADQTVTAFRAAMAVATGPATSARIEGWSFSGGLSRMSWLAA